MGRALLFLFLLASLTGAADAAPISVVAAENVYGDLAEQLGGDAVSVVSILKNPNQDPHLFEVGAATGRAIATSSLVLYNGLDYDPWMAKLLSASAGTPRTVIVAADLSRHAPGDNPHLWYETASMRAVARAITKALIAADPGGEPEFTRRLREFEASVTQIDARIMALRSKYKGIPVTATEPVFDYVVHAIGLDMRNGAFQLAVMNDTEPSAKDIAAFQDDLRRHRVAVLFYNLQVAEELTGRLRELAEEAHVPVVGVTETEPPDRRYQGWMGAQLDALDRALAGSAR